MKQKCLVCRPSILSETSASSCQHTLSFVFRGIKSIGAGCGGREKTNCWFLLLKAWTVMEGTKIRPQERVIGILWEVIYRVEIDERCWPLAFAPGFSSKLPSFVLLQSARYLLTSLTSVVFVHHLAVRVVGPTCDEVEQRINQQSISKPNREFIYFIKMVFFLRVGRRLVVYFLLFLLLDINYAKTWDKDLGLCSNCDRVWIFHLSGERIHSNSVSTFF